MRSCALWLLLVSLVAASSSVFSVQDDLLAFPQYELIFSETFILKDEADSRVAQAASASPSKDQSASSVAHQVPPVAQEPTGELSRQASPDAQDASDSSPDYPSSYESMILKDRPYLCQIPSVSIPSQNETTRAKDKAEEAAEIARATDRGSELLKDMEGHCMYFISGWWSYSFCYNTDVKQFHQLPPGKGAPNFPP
ncbi:MAG: hypothetical protein Q9174_004849, partial [Haloplaca sp. 1 TL-2023]